MPDLDRVRQRYGNQSLEVIGFALDDDVNPVREFQRRTKVSFPLVLDTNRELASQVGVRQFPTSFLIGRNGRVREVVVGARPWQEYQGIASLVA
jgi:peroxiredoxin